MVKQKYQKKQIQNYNLQRKLKRLTIKLKTYDELIQKLQQKQLLSKNASNHLQVQLIVILSCVANSIFSSYLIYVIQICYLIFIFLYICLIVIQFGCTMWHCRIITIWSKSTPFTSEIKKLAITLQLYSSKAQEYVRKIFKNVLHQKNYYKMV